MERIKIISVLFVIVTLILLLSCSLNNEKINNNSTVNIISDTATLNYESTDTLFLDSTLLNHSEIK